MTSILLCSPSVIGFRRAASPEIQALMRDPLYYSPLQHTGDRLASLLFARWGIEQGSRKVEVLEGARWDFTRR